MSKNRIVVVVGLLVLVAGVSAMKRFIIAMVLGIAAWSLTPNCQAQGSLEQGLLKQAPKLIKYFQEHGYRNIGVLKFQVSREGEPSNNVGAFNLLAARRLERG